MLVVHESCLVTLEGPHLKACTQVSEIHSLSWHCIWFIEYYNMLYARPACVCTCIHCTWTHLYLLEPNTDLSWIALGAISCRAAIESSIYVFLVDWRKSSSSWLIYILQWTPGELICDATYSCDGHTIYASCVRGHIVVLDSSSFAVRCIINPSAYIPLNPRYMLCYILTYIVSQKCLITGNKLPS